MTVFLCYELKEDIYLDQKEGFEENDKENLLCKLKKGPYALTVAPWQ